MAITRATNIAGLGTVFDALTDSGGLEVTSGVSTISHAIVGSAVTMTAGGIVAGLGTINYINATHTNISGVSTITDLIVTGLTGTAVTFTTATITNATISGDLTVQGTTTTLDTTVENVDLLEVGANSAGAAVTITQAGSGEFLHVGTAGSAFTIKSNGNAGLGTNNPGARLEVRDGSSQGIIIRSDSTQLTDTNKALRVRNNSDTNTFHLSHKGQGYFASSVGIGSEIPAQPLDIASTAPNIRFTDTIDGHSEIDGNAAELKFNADKGNTKADSKITFFVDNDEKLRITSAGSVGIGTDNPAETLDVQGNIRVGFATTSNYISFQGTYKDGSEEPGVPQSGSYARGTHTYIGERIHADIESSELLFFKGNDSTSTNMDRIRHVAGNHVFDIIDGTSHGSFEAMGATPRQTAMIITDDFGNLVGIGTTNPKGELEVFSTTFCDITVHSARTSGNIGGLNFKNGNSATGVTTAQYYVSVEGHHHWASRGDVGMRLLNDGRLGINNESPDTELHISGNATADNAAIELGSNYYGRIYRNNNDLDIISNGDQEYRVSLGTNNGTGNISFQTASGTTGNTERMRIKHNGFVGINTDNPRERLQVNGNMLVGLGGTSSYISFSGTTGDQPGNFNHTHIGERIHGGTEKSEFVILKGNDTGGSTGADRIRMCGYGVLLDNWDSNGALGSFGEMSALSSTTLLEAYDSKVTTSVPIYCTGDRMAVGLTSCVIPSGASKFFAIGDSDTGIAQNGDGVFKIITNGVTRVTFDNGGTDFENNVVSCTKGFNVAVASQNISDILTGASGDGIITRAAGQMYITVDDYLRIRDSGSTSENKKFECQTNTGNAGADANWNSNNFDFAEMFEWSDGNPESEDRIGYSVCVDTLTGKIRKAEEGDTPFGIVSGTASFVANAGEHKWVGYAKRDEWGRILQEPYVDENGDPVLDDDGNQRTKMAVNPEWDEELTQSYTPRSQRPEWAAVGVMGQVYMRKGCPIDSRWVKLKEVDEVKDLWLVR